MPLLLDNPVRSYAWGSRTVIPDLIGERSSGEPQAELWMGAHPAASSVVTVAGRPIALADLIAADPEATLGRDVTERFGARLPYLLKILAIERPLSIQAHPTISQAEAGYAREDAAGIPLDAPHRSYRDRWHKPEMIVALTDVEALLGFRDPVRTAELMAELDVPGLADAAAELRKHGDGALSDVVRRWLEVPDRTAADLVRAVVASATGSGAGATLSGLLRRLAGRYPADRGILLAMLLRHERLRPGEAAYIPAGVPHAYLRGVAVEPQASSDNTLRAGLTDKHVDTGELLRILRYESTPDPRVEPAQVGPHHTVFAPGVAEFRLSRVTVGGPPVDVPAAGPHIVLVTDGSTDIGTANGTLRLPRGRSAFVPAEDGPPSLSGAGVAFVASPGSPPP